MNEALLSSKNMCWCTPVDLFNELDQEFHFDLDPACTHKSAKCKRHFTPEEDGLAQSWGGESCLLQPALRQSDRGLGAEGIRGEQKAGHSGRYAYTGKDRHAVLSRVHFREGGRDTFPSRTREIYRRGRHGERSGSIPFGRHCMEIQGAGKAERYLV